MNRAMRIVVIGTGHVGLVTAGTLAALGHDVVGVDGDSGVIEGLREGRCPFFEPDLPDLVADGLTSGRLTFDDDPSRALPGAEVAFICVGTPGRPSGEPNLVAVEQVARTIGQCATAGMVVVEKSTVPVQTAERIKVTLERTSSHCFHVVSSPEFLREGLAVQDSLNPERILVGASDSYGHEVMREVYRPILDAGVPFHATDLPTAELAKHACNAFLALKISFANALARVCEASGADVVKIAEIMGSDPRIGPAFLSAGLGFGGSCFPKDLAAFRAQAARLGYEFRLLDEVVRINEEAVESAFVKIREALWNLEGKRIAMLGLAFKPGTDDVREAPALRLAAMLIAAGATVVGHDPWANERARAELPDLEVVDDPYVAADGAHCLVVATEWPEFGELDLIRIKGVLTHPILVDCRNLFSSESMVDTGLTYIPTGRPGVNL